MGIVQSVISYLGSEIDELESKRPQYDYPILDSRQTKQFLTISVLPDLRHSSSLASTSVTDDDKVKKSVISIKETSPETTASMGSSGVAKGSDREEGESMIKCTVGIRWITHYSSSHRILLVGEGDFSFSTCLAAAFGWASNMIATSLDSQVFLVKNYQNAVRNIMELSIRKCKVIHEIDATKMANHPFLGGIKFDRIIFNFPFAGFFKNLPRYSQLKRHRKLVGMFLKNAKEMISENGEIHVSHKTNDFHTDWNLKSLGAAHRLELIEAVDFNGVDYPGYNTKCGFGGDNNFNCYPSKTYKFGFKC
ncbi:hypothetical protein ABFS83_13G153600 [Erythranthe nasuta]